MDAIRGTTSARRFLDYVANNTSDYDRDDVVEYFRNALNPNYNRMYADEIFSNRDTMQRDIIEEHLSELERRLRRPSRRF